MTKAICSMGDGYIELNREFLEVSKNDETELAESRYWREYHGGGYGWPDLLERRRVVLLAEASSGKTEEFRHRVIELQAKGHIPSDRAGSMSRTSSGMVLFFSNISAIFNNLFTR